MDSEKGLRVFLGSLILLAVSLLIYYIRYPMWEFFSFIEPIFALEFLSYFIIFIVALLLLKKDSRVPVKRIQEQRKLRGSDGTAFHFALFGIVVSD